MSSFYAVTSGKGGVGKSSVCVGLAFAFSDIGKKVLLIDMDEGFKCLDLMLGIDKKAVFDLSDILMGKDPESALYSSEHKENLYLIPAPAKQGMLDYYSLSKFIYDISEKFDIIIFDFPAGMDISLYKSLPEKTLFLTVAIPEQISVRDACVIGNALQRAGIKANLIINRFVYKQSRKYNFKNIDSIIDSASLKLIGIVPESEEIADFPQSHKLKAKSKAFMAFSRIAKRLEGENILLPKLKKI